MRLTFFTHWMLTFAGVGVLWLWYWIWSFFESQRTRKDQH